MYCFWTKNPGPMLGRFRKCSKKFANYNPDSPLLCSTVALGDKITDKKSKKFERKTVKFI